MAREGKTDYPFMPWVPLMRFDGKPESLLEACADKIERRAEQDQRTDLLVISEVMAGLRYPAFDVASFFGEQKAMIESPVLQKWMAAVRHEDIIDVLRDRFGAVPRDVTKPLRMIIKEKKLRQLVRLAAKCPDLDAFREALIS